MIGRRSRGRGRASSSIGLHPSLTTGVRIGATPGAALNSEAAVNLTLNSRRWGLTVAATAASLIASTVIVAVTVVPAVAASAITAHNFRLTKTNVTTSQINALEDLLNNVSFSEVVLDGNRDASLSTPPCMSKRTHPIQLHLERRRPSHHELVPEGITTMEEAYTAGAYEGHSAALVSGQTTTTRTASTAACGLPSSTSTGWVPRRPTGTHCGVSRTRRVVVSPRSAAPPAACCLLTQARGLGGGLPGLRPEPHVGGQDGRRALRSAVRAMATTASATST